MPTQSQSITILGAGVIGLSTALTLSASHPDTPITIVATHFPGDRSINYCSPWAGANWSSMATDNGPLEHYDLLTFHRFTQLLNGETVHGCRVSRPGEGNDAGLGKMGMWAFFDAEKEEAGVLSEGTGKVWYDGLVGGIREMRKEEMPGDAVYGMDIPSTFRINTQVYLQWLQAQALSKGITLIRRTYPSISSLLTDIPATTLLVNCTGIGSLHLSDIKDTALYPTRGQTLLIEEPKVPITRMYEFEQRYLRSQQRIHPTTTYIFPRPLHGGIILGGSRDDNNWSAEWDEQLGRDIIQRCCELCPELGSVGEVERRVVGRNVGLRPSRNGGPRIKFESDTRKWGVPVIHCYGHSGAGFQSSWGTAERVLELVHEQQEQVLTATPASAKL
ncbi:D-amino-acid oxidase-like protein [Plenodomus tracheiphilus IPT5]|uniref:D-amino-acid oxidase-like protein n=1 Tax=Plenodomus tracheiphilus IPT5 TaxID=1408161 RepID=A0A6A7BDG9_9PLEO|nr:D-amino-acid oxidase-like protein [Plenodomus tracheiphilus IPT5]